MPQIETNSGWRFADFDHSPDLWIITPAESNPTIGNNWQTPAGPGARTDFGVCVTTGWMHAENRLWDPGYVRQVDQVGLPGTGMVGLPWEDGSDSFRTRPGDYDHEGATGTIGMVANDQATIPPGDRSFYTVTVLMEHRVNGVPVPGESTGAMVFVPGVGGSPHPEYLRRIFGVEYYAPPGWVTTSVTLRSTSISEPLLRWEIGAAQAPPRRGAPRLRQRQRADGLGPGGAARARQAGSRQATIRQGWNGTHL